jgi:hypothetical protein
MLFRLSKELLSTISEEGPTATVRRTLLSPPTGIVIAALLLELTS